MFYNYLSAEALYIPEVIYDFGKIVDKSSVSHTFEIYNRTNQPIRIEIVHQTCDCTTVTLSPPTVPPYGKSLLIIVIDLSGRRGGIEVSLTLRSDEPDLNEYCFYLTGYICSSLQCDPSYIHLGNLEYGKTYRQIFKISAFTGNPLKNLRYNSDSKMFSIVKLIDGADPEYEKLALVEITPTEYGEIMGTLCFIMDDITSHVATTKIEANVVNQDDIFPQAIFLNGKDYVSGEIKIPLRYSIESSNSFILLKKLATTGNFSIYQYTVKIPETEKNKFGKIGFIKVRAENKKIVSTIPIFH